MPPQWASKLFELLGKSCQGLTAEDRQKLRDYVDVLLPGGLRSCGPSTSGSAG